MILWWMIGAGIALALIASLATVFISGERLKASGYIAGVFAVLASAAWGVFTILKPHPIPTEFVAARFLLAYYGLFLAGLAWYGPRAIVERRQRIKAASAAAIAAREAERREQEARQAAALRAKQEAEERQRAAAFAQRLADLEKWCLQMYAYYSVQVDFDGSRSFEERRAGFQAYIRKSDVPDLQVLLYSQNPKVQALVLGMAPAAIR